MSAELELQGAIVGALKAANVAGDRIYDRVPSGADRPYVHIRSLQAVSADADCVEAYEVFVEVDVWSDAVGKPEAANLAALVRSTLRAASPSLGPSYRLLELNHRDTVVDTDDTLLTRARITFEALIETV